METAAVDRSKSGGVSDFVKLPALIAGIVTAGGYLFLLFFAAIYSADALAKPLTLAIIGLLAGVATVVLSLIFRGLVRSIIVGGIGLLLIILPLAMAVCPAPGMDATLGGTAPLGIIAMLLLTWLLGTLHARSLNPENAIVRWLLTSLSGALIMTTLIMWLVYLAGGTAEAERVGGIFGTETGVQVVNMILFIIVAVAELGIFVLALISSLKQSLGAKLAKLALLIAKLLLPVIVLMVLVISIIAIVQVEEGTGRMVIQCVTMLLAGLAPLVAAILMGALGLSGSLLEAAACCAGPRPVAATVEPAPVAPAPQFAPAPAPQPEPAPAPAPNPARTHQPAPAAPAEPPVTDVERQLENLKRLADKGLITSEEYAAKRRDILSRL